MKNENELTEQMCLLANDSLNVGEKFLQNIDSNLQFVCLKKLTQMVIHGTMNSQVFYTTMILIKRPVDLHSSAKTLQKSYSPANQHWSSSHCLKLAELIKT